MPDPCSTAPCHVNATCAQVGLSNDFTCSCTFPLTRNGSNTETGCVGRNKVTSYVIILHALTLAYIYSVVITCSTDMTVGCMSSPSRPLP